MIAGVNMVSVLAHENVAVQKEYCKGMTFISRSLDTVEPDFPCFFQKPIDTETCPVLRSFI